MRKSYSKGKRSYKRRSNSGVKKLYKKVNYLAKLTSPEVKKVDIGFGPTTLSGSSGNTYLLTNISRGDNPDQRQGDKINCKYHTVKGIITFDPISTQAGCRIVIIRDNQQIADTSPTVLDVFKEVSYFSPLNAAHVGRFSILASKSVYYNSTRTNQPFSLFVKKFTRCRFNGSTGGDQQKNAVYIMFIPKYVSIFPNTSTVEAITRTGYTDA